MDPLLRKIRETRHGKAHVNDLVAVDTNSIAPFTIVREDDPVLPVHHSPLRDCPAPRSTRSTTSIKSVRIVDYYLPFAELRRRLARKVTAFTVRPKVKQGDCENLNCCTPRAHTLIAFENEVRACWSEEHRGESVPPLQTPLSDEQSAPYPPPILRATPNLSTTSRASYTQQSPQLYTGIHTSASQAKDTRAQQLQDQFLEGEEGYPQFGTDNRDNSALERMANEVAGPPVSYERLRQLTTEACSSTLSSTKSYSHADTEGWNTNIINTILAALVQESTPTSGTEETSQPNFKFIVNSTIIQHAPLTTSSGDEEVRRAGRRGMHSASGAFWNNERDGMWSFKYEAAEAKGLDVVVGIIWIWVG